MDQYDQETGEVWEESPPVGERTGFTAEQAGELKAKLDRRRVSTRPSGSGRALSYIEGWWAIREANRIFGFDGWQRETIQMQIVSEREAKIGTAPKQRDGWAVGYLCRCRIRVLAGNVWLVREGTGYGSGIDVAIGQAHESAAKEAETDAMKRALMTFGNPFGLALYDKTQAEVGAPEPVPTPAAEVIPPQPSAAAAPAKAAPRRPPVEVELPVPPVAAPRAPKPPGELDKKRVWDDYNLMLRELAEAQDTKQLNGIVASQDYDELREALRQIRQSSLERLDMAAKQARERLELATA